MAIGGTVVTGLYDKHLTGGIGPANTELRVSLDERWNANADWASETGIEYALWPLGASETLDNLGAPSLQGTNETTDANGLMVINTAGTFSIGQNVLVSVRKELAGPASETVYGFGEESITEV